MTMSSLQNPFVGLRPYQSSDSLFYFGRNEQTKTLLRLLHQHRFVAVVGSSGAGKSSLIRAGLVPQLEAGFLVQARDQWLVASTKPGDSPLSNLVSSLLQALSQDGSNKELDQDLTQLIESINENGTQALIQYIEPVLANSDTNLFILVDQFEELFRFGLAKGKSRNRQEAEQYVALLLTLSRNDLPINVCLTMRSDFLGDCDAFYGLPEAINKSQFLVPRLTRSQRQEVITHPVNLAGAKISQRLVDKLLNENIDTRDDLPILQHALMRTWDDWQAKGDQGELDVQHYENIHTIHEALDRHADEAFEELTTDKQKHIAKVLFQALTTVDAGNRRIRRPVHLDEVCAISGASPEAVMQVIECFCERSRSFLVLSSNEITDNPLIDISHESLIRQWKTLDKWVEEESEAADTYVRLVATSQRYQESRADLLRHIELEQALTWQKQLPKSEAAEIWAERYDQHFTEANEFLQLSEAAHIQKLAEEKEVQEHQAKLLKEKAELEEQKRIIAEQKSEEQRRLLKKIRRISGLMAMLLVFVVGVALFAVDKARKLSSAQIDTRQALKKSKTKELEANYNLAKAFEEKSLFSISRGDVLASEEPFSPRAKSEYRNAILYALETQTLQMPNDKTAIQPDSLSRTSNIPSSALQSEIHQTPHSNIRTISSSRFDPDGKVIAYSPDGKVIASGSDDNTIRLWNAQSGKTISTLKGHTRAVKSITYSPNGKVIASGSDDNTIRLWNAQSGETINTLRGHSKGVRTVAYSPDGKVIASGSDDFTIRLWNAQSGETINTLTGYPRAPSSITYSPDGRVIASGFYDNTIRLLESQSGETINILKGHSGLVQTIAYSPDGKVIASGSYDSTIRFWDAQSGETINTLKEHPGRVQTIAYSPDGKIIASGSADNNTTRLWDAQSGIIINTLTGNSHGVSSIVYSPDGKVIASGSSDHTIRLWDAQTGVTIDSLKGHSGGVETVAFNPDGKALASGSHDSTIRLWNAQSGETINTLKGHSDWVQTIAYSPDGNVIASGSSDYTIRLWNAQSGKPLNTLKGHSRAVNSIAYSPDSKVIASTSDGHNYTIRLWNVQSGETINILKGHSAWVYTVAYSPDGKVIASGSRDNTIRLWNSQSGETINILKGHTDPISSLAYSPNGEVIASGSYDNTIRLWNAQSGKLLNTLKGHSDWVQTIAYSPDGKTIASGSHDRTIRLWDTQSGETINILKGHTNSVRTIAYSPDGKAIIAGSGNNIRFWKLGSLSPLYRFVYDFDPSEVSGALRFLWELELDGLNFKYTPRPKSLIPELGYRIAWTDETRKFRPLLDMPDGDDTKMDQVVKWLEKRCAYKQPERYGCTPAKATEKSPN